MEYTDLHLFGQAHPPSPYDHPVLIMKDGHGGEGFLPKDLSLYAVGWIERQGFTTGQVSEDCIHALFTAHASHIVSDGTRGIHICTLCGIATPQIKWRGRTLNLVGHGHYLVQNNNAVFMAPELVLHYVLDHQYCPPREFAEATRRGRFLAPDDLDVKWKD